MFSFISAQSLGAFESINNRITLPIAEDHYRGASGTSVYVNTNNGNLHLANNDLVLSGVGLDLKVRRYYNAQSQTNPWNICATAALKVQDTAPPMVTEADGTVITFQPNQEGVLVSYTGSQGEIRLTQTSGVWCMDTVATGERKYFDSNGFILSEENASSGRITYQYENQQLSCITNASGQAVQVVRDDAGRVQSLEVNGQPHVQYRYDHLSRLQGVTYLNPENHQTYDVKYQYEGNSCLLSNMSEDDGHSLGMVFQSNKLSLNLFH